MTCEYSLSHMPCEHKLTAPITSCSSTGYGPQLTNPQGELLWRRLWPNGRRSNDILRESQLGACTIACHCHSIVTCQDCRRAALDLSNHCWYPLAPSRVAQLVEQLTVNQRVVGSSPTSGAWCVCMERVGPSGRPVQCFCWLTCRVPRHCLGLGLQLLAAASPRAGCPVTARVDPPAQRGFGANPP